MRKNLYLIHYSIFVFILFFGSSLFAQNPHLIDSIPPSAEEIQPCGISDLNGNYLAAWHSGFNKIYTYCPNANFRIGINTEHPQQAFDIRGNQYLSGKLGIGTMQPQYAIDVRGAVANSGLLRLNNSNGTQLIVDGNGKLITKEIEVSLQVPLGDFVFNDDYKLMTLCDLEQFIDANSHLPGVPSQADVDKEGLNLGEMNAVLLQKIEELTLHVIDLNKKLEEQARLIEEFKNQSNE